MTNLYLKFYPNKQSRHLLLIELKSFNKMEKIKNKRELFPAE